MYAAANSGKFRLQLSLASWIFCTSSSPCCRYRLLAQLNIAELVLGVAPHKDPDIQ